MSTKDPAALRAGRKSRLASLSAETQSYDKTEEAPKAPAAVTTPPATTATQDLVANVLDPQEVVATAVFEMHLFNEQSADPHWMLTADGRPVAEIRLSDQEDPRKLATVFCDSRYAKGVISVASQADNLSDVLEAVRARPYIARVSTSDAIAKLRSEIKAEFDAERRSSLASMKGDFVNMLNLVVAAQTKNFIVDNILKDALFNSMKRAGIDDDRAVAIIEQSFQEKSAEYHDQLFAQASKWSELSPEALSEIREQIGEMPVRTPVVEASTEIPRVASTHNVPFKTYAGSMDQEPTESAKDSLRGKLSIGSRHK